MSEFASHQKLSGHVKALTAFTLAGALLTATALVLQNDEKLARLRSFNNAERYLNHQLIFDRNKNLRSVQDKAESVCGILNSRLIVIFAKSRLGEIETLGELPIYVQVPCGPDSAVSMADVVNATRQKRAEIISGIRDKYRTRADNSYFIAFITRQLGCGF